MASGIAQLFRLASAAGLLAFSGNAARPGRSAYLALTLAVAVAAWLGLAAMASPFVHVASTSKDNDITVRSARRGQSLPTRYAERIAAYPEALDVTYVDLQLVTCNSAGDTVTLNAIGGPGTQREAVQSGADARAIAAWEGEPLSILVDSKLAARCGWHAGMGVAPPAVDGPPLEIHIAGTFDPRKSDGGVAYAHYAYINRMAPFAGRDRVLMIHAHAADPRDNDRLAARIEAGFAHDDPPVEAVPDTVNQNAWARFGKVQYLLALVMGAIFLCCALVLVSVLAHAATQRRAQMALLCVLGFPRALLFAAWVLEGLLIVLAGAALGIALGLGATRLARQALGALFGGLTPPTWAWAMLPVWLLVLLTAALATPALVVARIRPTDCREL